MPDLEARGYGPLLGRGVVEAAGGVQAGARHVVHTLALGRAVLVEGGAGRGHGLALVTDFLLAGGGGVGIVLRLRFFWSRLLMFQFQITLHTDCITKRLYYEWLIWTYSEPKFR